MLRHLFNFYFLQFFVMMFAAGAAIGDVGVGGGDGADSGDAGDSGDVGTSDDASISDDDSVSDSGDDNSADDAGADADVDADASTDPDAPVDLGDGRQVPAKWKKLFDAAQKAGVAKEAKQLYFANQRLNKAIPGGINGAIELARTVEQFGGVEGIEQLQADLQTHQQDATNFAENPAKWVESGFQENSDAALKAFAHSIDFVGEQFPDHYDHLMAKVITNDIGGAISISDLHRVLASAKDNAEAQQLAKQLKDWWNDRVEKAKQTPERKPDAQAKALSDREAAIKKQEMEVRFRQVNQEVLPTLKSEVTKVLLADAKTDGLDLQKLSKEYPAEWRNMLNEIHQEILKAAVKDQRFIDKYYSLVSKGDLKRAAKAINDKHAQIAGDITRKVKASYGVFRAKKAAGKGKPNAGSDQGNNNNAAQNQGWLRVSKRPENSSINWSRTTSAMQLDGKYILNDGKKVVVQY